MKSEKQVQQQIKDWIKRCEEFLEKDERGEIGKQIKASDRIEIESSNGEKCPTCPEKMPLSSKHKHRLTVEHIIPRCLGGNNTRANLVAMCQHCNQYRNAVMMLFLPPLPNLRGIKLKGSTKTNLSRFIEWAIRTIHTPESEKIDRELSQLFVDYSAPSKNSKKTIKHKKKARKKANSKVTGKSKKHQAIASDEVLEVLKEILETQKAILERLQKSPLHRFKDWIIGLFPKKKTRSPIEVKSKRRSSHRHRSLKKNEMEMTSNNNTSKPIHKYFCPTCNTLFTKWKQAKLHKKETGHGCRVCDECGAFFGQERFRQAHEEDTGHTNYSGNFYGQKRMSIKHYLPEERLVTMETLGKNEIDVEGFSKLIEILLGEDEVSAPNIGQRVRRYQKANEWPRLGSKAFLDAFGIPSNTGLVNAIVSIMGDRVTVIGDNPVSRKLSLTQKQTTSKPEQDEGDFPLISGLNSSSKGFRFPRYPYQLAEALIWFEQNHQLHPTTNEIKFAMRAETELTRTRTSYLLSKLVNIVKPKSQGGITSADWSTASNIVAIDILDLLQTQIYEICLANQIEFTGQDIEYFTQVRNYISGNTEEE